MFVSGLGLPLPAIFISEREKGRPIQNMPVVEIRESSVLCGSRTCSERRALAASVDDVFDDDVT